MMHQDGRGERVDMPRDVGAVATLMLDEKTRVRA